jgi:hypothetical protein
MGRCSFGFVLLGNGKIKRKTCDNRWLNTDVNMANKKLIHCVIYNGPTNALVCNKTLIQMSHIKTLKITPT